MFMRQAIKSCRWTYEELLRKGVCPEQARMVLPQSMMTEWYWSGTLYAFACVCNLRCKPDAQVETQMVADRIDKLAEELFPVRVGTHLEHEKGTCHRKW